MKEKEFVKYWIDKLKGKELKNFPDDFIDPNSIIEIELPGKTLVLGPELFGSYELLDAVGETLLQIESLAKAKYILYANRLKPRKLKLPTDEVKLSSAVKAYERHLDSLVQSMGNGYRSKFPNGKHFFEISNQVFNSLNLQRY